jgi:hypothetical protein
MNEYKKKLLLLLLHEKAEKNKIKACITMIDNCLTEVLTCLLTPENASVAPLVALIT